MIGSEEKQALIDLYKFGWAQIRVPWTPQFILLALQVSRGAITWHYDELTGIRTCMTQNLPDTPPPLQ